MIDPTIVNLISTVVIAGLAAIPATILAYATLQKSKDNEKKSDIIIEKAAEIHTLTNSNLNAVTQSLKVANEKINGLERLMAEMVSAKKLADKKESDNKK